MNLYFFNEFQDDYLRNNFGQGIFLSGVVLGYIARNQVSGDREMKNAPLFKQIPFGRLDVKTLKRLMARVPQFLNSYEESIPAVCSVEELANQAGILMMAGPKQELGVDGNFAFSVGFGNATSYFWNIIRQEKQEVLWV